MGETTTGQGVLSALPDSTKQRVIECDWHGLYRAKWGRNRLQPESFAHPAKAAYGLAVRIAKYLLEQNYIRPGDLVLDPFGGIGGFALPLIERGVNVVLVELEQRFNDMAQGCECTGISKEDWIRFQGRYDKARYLDGRYWCPRCVMQAQTVPPRKFNPFKFTSDEWARWNDRGFHQPTLFGSVGSATYERNSGRIPFTGPHHYTGNLEAWNEAGYEGRAVMLQGDSRRLCDVLAGAGVAGAVSSPPYAGIATSSGQRLVGHGKAQLQRRWSEWHEDTDRYGETPGQLASLPEGDVPQVQAGAVVSSMPYANSLKQEGQFQKVGSPGYTGLKAMNDGYSRDPANLGNLPAGEPPAAIVSSMPFTNSLASDDPDKRGGLFRDPKRRRDRNMTGEYGVTPGQLGAMAEGQPIRICNQLEVMQCQSVQTVESPSQDAVGDAGHVPESMLAHCSRDARNPMDLELRSPLPNSTSQLPSVGANCIHIGLEEVKVGEDMLGAPRGGQPLNEMNTDVADVVQPGDCRSITDVARMKREENGIIPSVTLKYSAPSATLPFTAQRLSLQPALSAVSSTSEEVQGHAVQQSANENQSIVPTGSLQRKADWQDQPDTFWSAASAIMRQVYQVLAPGAVAVWVCKAFVRKGKRVDFPGQWQALGESCGFETIEIIRAWLVEDRGAQHTLDGGLEQRQVARKSFFRLLAERNGSPRIDYEIVLIQRKVGER